MLLVSGDNKADRAFYEEMAELSGRPMLMNVVQAFDHRPDIHRRVLAWLESCRERGIRVIGQGLTTDAGFNFTFEDWNLFDDSQAWCEATTGSREERKRKLADPARRQALKDHMPITATGPLPDIVIVGPKLEKNARFEDCTLAIAGEAMGKHPVDVMLDMAVEEDLATEFFAAPPNGDIGHLREIVDNPYVLFGVSDGGAHTKFLTAGRYPTETLCKIVREHEMLSPEEAHWRLSALPAMVAGFEGRGVLRKGAPADIVVYDYERLRVLPAEVTHDLPGDEWRRVQRAEGYRYVLVNGEVTIRDDRETGTCFGPAPSPRRRRRARGAGSRPRRPAEPTRRRIRGETAWRVKTKGSRLRLDRPFSGCRSRHCNLSSGRVACRDAPACRLHSMSRGRRWPSDPIQPLRSTNLYSRTRKVVGSPQCPSFLVAPRWGAEAPGPEVLGPLSFCRAE